MSLLLKCLKLGKDKVIILHYPEFYQEKKKNKYTKEGSETWKASTQIWELNDVHLHQPPSLPNLCLCNCGQAINLNRSLFANLKMVIIIFSSKGYLRIK